MSTTVAQMMINEALPAPLRRDRHDFDKKSLHALMNELAEQHPDQYRETLHRLNTLGAQAGWEGGASISLTHLRKSAAKERILAPVKAEIERIKNDPTLTDDEVDQKITSALLGVADTLPKAVLEESKQENSPFYHQVNSGGRGKASDLNSLRGADLLAAGRGGKFVPVPILNSYADGYDPVELFAGSFAQREGMAAVKLATADAGFISKKLAYGTHRQVVTHETPHQHRHPVGLPVKADDRENLGSVLSHDAGTFKAGTIITPQVIEHLKDQGVEDLLVASPMTEMTVDGGISRWAAGKRDQGGMSRVGTNIGLAAAQTYGEKLSQGQLGAKHRTSMGRKVLGGIPYITKLLEAPEHFPEAGPLAEEDGHVKSVRKAPQGGHEVTVGDRLHFINQGLEPIVKEGDLVERGDDLSDGVPHPRDLVRLRGHGEARRVFLKHFQDAARETGADGGRRNAESVVAGLLNWARVTTPDGIGDNVVDDIVPANRLYSQYRPREGSEELAPAMAHGHYLEEPVLHYTPGTYVTKKVAKEIQAWKVPTIHVHKDPPHFEPHMERSVLAVYHDPDWQTRLQGFYTTGAFLNSLHRSGTSDANSTSYVPALARGFGFGEDLATKGTYGTSKTELPRGPMG